MQRETLSHRAVRAVGDAYTPTGDGRPGDGRLAHLTDLAGVRVADGAPDVRGWPLKSADGRTLGTVEDLLVDPEAMQVRYIEVKLDRRLPKADAERHILVPIGTARLDGDRDDVLLDGGAAQLAGVPAYARGMLDREYEASVLGSYGAGMAARRRGHAWDGIYDMRHFDERVFLGRRRRGRTEAAYLTRVDRGRARS